MGKEETFNIALTIRMTESMFKDMKELFGSGKLFRDQVDAARGLIQRGMQFEKYMKIINNPEASDEARQMLIKLQNLNLNSDYIRNLSLKDFQVLKAIVKVEDSFRTNSDLMKFL